MSSLKAMTSLAQKTDVIPSFQDTDLIPSFQDTDVIPLRDDIRNKQTNKQINK